MGAPVIALTMDVIAEACRGCGGSALLVAAAACSWSCWLRGSAVMGAARLPLGSPPAAAAAVFGKGKAEAVAFGPVLEGESCWLLFDCA